MIDHRTLRRLFKDFWEDKTRAHNPVDPSPLVLQNDATTLFTSSGMQPLVPYLLGESHQGGTRVYDIQPCIRTQDIEEVGDNRHTTFFEMMGNWSFGDYFKKEQLPWVWEFFTEVLGLDKKNLYVTVFEGGFGVPKDTESIELWKSLGLADNHIYEYSAQKNWWSRSGPPEKMPAGEIGGPDSEVFFEFEDVQHDSRFGPECHPNCDCGRFLEIGNSVFIQYKKEESGEIVELSQKNVDYGGGLERILAAANGSPDIFTIDIFKDMIQEIETYMGVSYHNPDFQPAIRVIIDHMRAAVFLIVGGVVPSNKEHGYILRRMLRRSAVKIQLIRGHLDADFFAKLSVVILKAYDGLSGIDASAQGEYVQSTIRDEIAKFTVSLEKGLRHFHKLPKEVITEIEAFNLFQNYGFPFEITQELAKLKGVDLNTEKYNEYFQAHRDLSRTASAGKFKGGLADSSDQVVKYHTATHLLHQALKDVFGAGVRQEGSNITQERLRFDVHLEQKPTEEQLKQVETIINEKINAELPVFNKILDKKEAETLGAASFFKEKYGETVKVYFIGTDEDHLKEAYSKEFCGGPHVQNTKEIGSIEIFKVKKIGSNVVRIYAR